MEVLKSNTEKLINGLHKITGIKISAIRDYARENNIFDIIDHPMTIGVTDKQYGKLKMLKDFVNSYHYLRENEANQRITLKTSESAGNFFKSQIAYYREKEVVLCAYMDAKMHVISCEKISEGTVNASALFPREVLKRALQLDCVGIMLSHNHPGGGVEPSKEDINLTRKFTAIFNPLGINVLDHLIIADNQYFSMNEQGIIFREFEHISRSTYDPIQLQRVNEYHDDMEACP